MYNSGNSSKNVTGSSVVDGTVEAADLATAVNNDIADGVAGKATADLALPKAGGAMTGAITTNSTFDGVDVATRDGILTTTTATANDALPKAGGTMTGTIAGFTSTGIDDNATSTAITIDSAEHVSLAHGIGFNGDTAAANALDDYEEGTFTPTVNATAVSYNSQVGKYTKIGNTVHIDCYINIASITTTTLTDLILGLPFTSAATFYTPLASKTNGFSWGGSHTMITFQVRPSSTAVSAAASSNNAAFGDVNSNGFAASDWVHCAGSYSVA